MKIICRVGEARFDFFREGDEFFLKVVEARITFTKDKNDKVDGLVLHLKGDHTGKEAEVVRRYCALVPTARVEPARVEGITILAPSSSIS